MHQWTSVKTFFSGAGGRGLVLSSPGVLLRCRRQGIGPFLSRCSPQVQEAGDWSFPLQVFSSGAGGRGIGLFVSRCSPQVLEAGGLVLSSPGVLLRCWRRGDWSFRLQVFSSGAGGGGIGPFVSRCSTQVLEAGGLVLSSPGVLRCSQVLKCRCSTQEAGGLILYFPGHVIHLLKNWFSSATLPATWCYRFSARNGWPGVSTLELLSQYSSRHIYLSRAIPEMHFGFCWGDKQSTDKATSWPSHQRFSAYRSSIRKLATAVAHRAALYI